MARAKFNTISLSTTPAAPRDPASGPPCAGSRTTVSSRPFGTAFGTVFGVLFGITGGAVLGEAVGTAPGPTGSGAGTGAAAGGTGGGCCWGRTVTGAPAATSKMKQKKKALRTGREYQNCAPSGAGRRRRVPSSVRAAAQTSRTPSNERQFTAELEQSR